MREIERRLVYAMAQAKQSSECLQSAMVAMRGTKLDKYAQLAFRLRNAVEKNLVTPLTGFANKCTEWESKKPSAAPSPAVRKKK